MDLILSPTATLVKMLAQVVTEKMSASGTASDAGTANLKAEADKQEIELRMAESQARVAQEVAIASRIERAEEVEMEEYYEYVAEGYAGGKVDGSSIGIGLSGSGKRVSKRVYRFKGFDPNVQSQENIVVE